MRTTLLKIATTLMIIGVAYTANAQTNLASDQNPNYQVSRQKYMQVADSINTWHSTTPQQTYKAIDYLEDKRLAKEHRRAFREELRLERARNSRRDYSYRQRGGYYNSRGSHYRYNGWNARPWWY